MFIKELIKFAGRKLNEKLFGPTPQYRPIYPRPAPVVVPKTPPAAPAPVEQPVVSGESAPVTTEPSPEEFWAEDDKVATPAPNVVTRSAAPSTAPCRNRKNIRTGQPCTNQVSVKNHTWGLCPECVHKCQDGCGRTIPVFHDRCRPCRAQSQPQFKVCKTCGQGELALNGPNYCQRCGHRCLGTDCDAVVPIHFDYCLADACQDEKWDKEHPAERFCATNLGKKLAEARAKQVKRSERDRAIRKSMKGAKLSLSGPGQGGKK